MSSIRAALFSSVDSLVHLRAVIVGVRERKRIPQFQQQYLAKLQELLSTLRAAILPSVGIPDLL